MKNTLLHQVKSVHQTGGTPTPRFKEAARELGADHDEAKFNEKLGKLVKQKPKDDDKCDD